jgi:hypothetical protein
MITSFVLIRRFSHRRKKPAMIKKIVIISSSIGIILNSALSTGTCAQTGRVHGSNIVPVQSGRCFVPIEPHRDAAVVSAARADDGADLVGEAWATNGPKLAHLNTAPIGSMSVS